MMLRWDVVYDVVGDKKNFMIALMPDIIGKIQKILI